MLMLTARPRLARSFGALTAAAILAGSTVAAAPAAAGQPTASAAKAGKKKASSKKSSKAKNKTVKAKGKAKGKAKRADNEGLLLTLTGTPAAGAHAGQSVTERWAFGGALFNIARTSSTNDTLSIWGPLIDDGTAGAGVAGPGRSSELHALPGGSYCFASDEWDAVWRSQRAYATKFRESVQRVEQLRTDASARAGLPAGPEIGGQPTVTAKLAVWPTVERTPATVAVDAATGAVRRITSEIAPDYAVDVTAWSVNASPTDAALLTVAGDPEDNPGAFVTGPCKR